MSSQEPSELSEWDGRSVEALEADWGLPGLAVVDRIDSTNASLRRRGRELPDFTTVVAEEQTAGRGRNGLPWGSPRGGLWFSVAFTPVPDAARALVPLRVGLAVAGAIHGMTGVAVGIKWPNDLWVGGRKLGGILVEGGSGSLVVGVGVNANSGPDPELCRTAPVTLRETLGATVSRSELLGAILNGMRARLSRGGARLVEEEHNALSALDVLSGRALRVDPGPEGRGAGIDRSGRLLVETEAGRVPVHSGTIELI